MLGVKLSIIFHVSGHHPCQLNNSGCSHLCLISSTGSKCVCPNHLTLRENGRTCYHKYGIYHYKCDLCDADYVGYACRHLYQRIEEHKGSAIGKHVRDQHGRDPSGISLRFKILRKCQSKFDCLIYEMPFVKGLKPTLNTQSDSIRAKLFL